VKVRWTTKLILGSGSVVVTLLLIEAVLRVIGYAPFQSLLDGRELIVRSVSDGSDGRYELTPGAKGHAWQTDVEVSSQGFRDREYPPLPPANTLRVLVLGDSITFGQKLPVRDTYADQLEELFANGPKRVEVINMAVSGYDTLDEISGLERHGIQLQPHLVVVGYCINDIIDASPDEQYLNRVTKYGSWIYHVRIAQLVQTRLDRIRAGQASRNDQRYASGDHVRVAQVAADPALQEAFHLLPTYRTTARDHVGWRERVFAAYASPAKIAWLRGNFERLARLARQHRFEVVVVPLPYLDERDGQRPFVEATYEIVSHEAARVGFPTIRTDDRFRTAGFDTLQIDPNDFIHFARAGHTIVARALYDVLQAR